MHDQGAGQEHGSVSASALSNVSKQTQRPFNEVLQHYALERWLFRLSQSRRREHLVLKGALMHIVWKAPARRPTRDIDLLGRLSNDLDSIRAVITEVCQTPVDDDGLAFDPASVVTERTLPFASASQVAGPPGLRA